MSDDLSDIAAYYNGDPQREHARLEQHQLEYELTWRYLDRYLPAQGSILEVGAGPGRYTLELARRGYSLTAVDLSAGLLETCRKGLTDAGLEKHVRLVEADARDLGALTGRQFDAVLLMGPLYHLVLEADRKLALKEAFKRLRPGGILVSAFISRFGFLCDMLKDHPEWIEQQAEVHSVLERGKSPDDFPRGGFRGYFVQTSEIEPLHQAAGFETLALAAVEPVIAADDQSYNKLEGIQRQFWLDLLQEVSTQNSLLGASRHLLYIGRKR